MLVSLHVKNLALIEETEVEFGEGLNILTGETGAGKSILIGSVNLALGARFDKDMLRQGAESALVELMFTCPPEDKALREKLRELEIPLEEDMVLISRRMQPGKSVLRINGETVSARQVKEVAELLIDMHGQHEHQSLLHKKNHLAFLDLYAKDQVEKLKKDTAKAFRTYHGCRKKLDESGMDERERQKEISLAEFEVNEIEEAGLFEGEDEEVEALYRRMSAGKKVAQRIAEAYHYTSEDESGNASELLSRAIHALSDVESVDEQGAGLYGQLIEIDSLLNDFNRELSEYAKSLDFSEEEFYGTENRLNELNRLKTKYGNSAAQVLEYCEERKQRLKELEDYEQYMQELEEQLKASRQDYEKHALALRKARKKAAVSFVKEIKKGLSDMNFLDVRFEMRFLELPDYTSDGMDEAEFYISTNPGEDLRPMGNVASGGELSRIMLAIKTVLADREDTPTLIFDEIDTGISGITAGKVAEKMHIIGESRQVLCITHLAQIAAQADAHYLIQKRAKNNGAQTEIFGLEEEESVQELARLLGGAKVTASILESAREMKR